jgi:hypothetical protein
MTRTTTATVRNLAAHFGLSIKYSNDLPDNVSGFLRPERAFRMIILNANKSESDHIFTILHEVAHYYLHVRRFHPKRMPWLLTRKWKSKRLRGYARLIKRNASNLLTDELEADIWAFCALCSIGAKNDLRNLSLQYPEKAGWGALSALCFGFIRVKCSLKAALSKIFPTRRDRLPRPSAKAEAAQTTA